ncbi:SusC/RagA family TonB-linked outer membrane protein [Niabella yanshanensis]|uniref:SusC/RagA family TonB-linked outer membrane protein n=1 Tax=Niabella yanshanensis TaxID=577386 RepID=A0ABZ0W0E1_9BACT|nr:SusC/RagA family TonB-linked outer membrane protein [Niabella yanshanensis]WQD36399.1 SusC/RagA family TonB-linked outer membrane protein [Niabella yanshanensis]
MNRLLLVLLTVFFCHVLKAQTKIITGTVLDEDEAPISGVNISTQDSKKTAQTNAQGKFTITIPAEENILLTFTSTGYKSQTAAGLDGMTITMVKNVVSEEDVVVVVDYGYGKIKKSDLTGSVATLSGKDLAKIPMASAASALTGRLPGVRVLTTDGAPDADVSIRVRGGGSITQDNSPLFVVDGLIVSSIRDIPPTDIESVNVLKDASATAIYGAAAANGVIVVTTKQPRAGRVSVSYNGFYQMKKLPEDRKLKVLSPYEFVLANYEHNRLQSDAAVRSFETFFGAYDDLELYKNKPANDWQDILFGSPRASQYHNLTLSGGTAMTKVFLSLTNNKDEGLLINNGFKRNALNFKLDQKINEKLSVGLATRITKSVVDGAGTSSAQLSIKDAVQTRPTNGLADEMVIAPGNIDPNDDFAQFIQSLVSPSELVKQDWRKRTTQDYVLNPTLEYKILSNLTFKSNYSYAKTFDENLRFYGPLTGESFNNGGNMPLGEKTDQENFSYRWFNTLNYRFRNLKNQTLDVLLGHETSSSGGKSTFIRSEDFRLSITPEELFANMAFGRTDRLQTGNATNGNRVSGFGRIDYQLLNKYMATFTFRGDASSRFSKENRLAFFPAAAVGWKISNEKFLSGVSWIKELKLRASYGATGNDKIPTTASQFLFTGTTNRGPGFGNVDNVYYTPEGSVLFNPNLKWETTINRNIGLDFTLFRSTITGSLDFYKNTVKDLLFQTAIPTNTGFGAQWANIGSNSNEGIELGLNADIIKRKDLLVSANFNIGRNVGKIVELDGTNSRFQQSNWASTDLRDRDDFYFEVGGRIGNVYGYVTDGYYQTSDFESYDEVSRRYILKEGVPNSGGTVGNGNVRPGFLKLKDLNGDGVINSEDRQVIGNTLPKAQGGFGFDVTYKSFDLSIFFDWTYGNDVYNAGKIQYSQFRRVTYGNLLDAMSLENRFSYLDVDGSYTGTPGGIVTDLTQLAEMNANKNIWSHASHGVAQAVIHSWAIEDGSFIRLNNLNVGYSLPKKWISKIGMNQFRVYFTGNNLKLWTKYSGYDPEVSTRGNGLTPGVDNSGFPRSRSFTFGVNVTF